MLTQLHERMTTLILTDVTQSAQAVCDDDDVAAHGKSFERFDDFVLGFCAGDPTAPDDPLIR